MSDYVNIYLFGTELGLFKIGMTTNMVNSRLQQCNVLSPVHVYLVAETYADKYLERELHAKYDSKRVRGEWFRLSQDDVDWIKSRFVEADMTVKYIKSFILPEAA